jgi:hypothetical protein
LRQKAFDLESLFPGSNLNLIQARISESFLKAMDDEAKGREYTIPELIREWLAFHLIPGMLKRKLDSGVSLESRERFVLEAYRGILEELEQLCNQIIKAHEDLEAKAEVKKMDFSKKPHGREVAKRWGREITDDLFSEKGIRKPQKGVVKKPVKKGRK